MIQKEKSKGFKRLIISVYLGLMLLFYLGYVLLDSYRLSKSEQWINTINLSQVDIQNIQQLGSWISTLEVSFSILMALATLLLFRYRKSRKTVVQFIILHLCLFITLFSIGYILSFFLIAPIGNLIQPLILSSFLLLIIVLYSTIRLIMDRLRKRITHKVKGCLS